MKRLITCLSALFVLALSVSAQLPNGFGQNYVLSGTYDSYGNPVSDPGTAQTASLLVVTTNFGFIQSSAILTLNTMVGSSNLSYKYTGNQNGWCVYVCDMGVAGSSYLLVSSNGNIMRVEKAWSGGNFAEYVAE